MSILSEIIKAARKITRVARVINRLTGGRKRKKKKAAANEESAE